MSEYLRGEMMFRVTVADTDCMGRLKPSAFMRFAQDLATEHAVAIGVGFHEMLEQHCIWVLTRMTVEFAASPEIGETVRMETYPKKPGLAECERDFYLYGADGRELGRATTGWSALDVESRRIRKARDFFARYPDSAFRPDAAIGQTLRRLTLPDDMRPAYGARVLYSDMDRNRHLNNTHYGDMMLNAFGADELNAEDVVSFDVVFEHEAMCGDDYCVRCGSDGEYRYVSAHTGGCELFASRFRTRAHEGGIL